MTSCPLAKPIRNAVIVSWIADVDASKSCAMTGKADRYMSIENGATAVSAASVAMKAGDVPAGGSQDTRTGLSVAQGGIARQPTPQELLADLPVTVAR